MSTAETHVASSNLGHVDEAASRRLSQICGGLLAAILLYYFLKAKTTDDVVKYQGLAILFLSALPTLRWAASSTKRFPLLEVFYLTMANSYAFPILNGHSEVAEYPNNTVSTAAWAVILFQASGLLSFHLLKPEPKKTPFWTEQLIPDDKFKYFSHGVWVNTIYLFISTYTTLIPGELYQVTRAACFGIGIICTFITAQTWGSGQLSPAERATFVLNLVLQTILQLTTLFLVGALSTLLLAMVGYVITKRRLPIFLCAALLAAIAILHNGKARMREKYWSSDGGKITPNLVQLPSFFSEWISDGLSPDETDSGQKKMSMTDKLISRTSLFQMICLVVYETPERAPYMNGDTYADLLAQFVPRPLWPGKPNGLQSTYRLSMYYGLQTAEMTEQTTIAFGQVAEAYANFGFFGTIALGVFFGCFYKTIQTWAANSPMVSYPGLLLVVLVAWSFQTEFTLSIWVASLYQACVSIFFLVVVAKKFLL